MLKESSCFTKEGSLGSCTSLRSCYPTIKLPQVNQPEMWVTFETCSYAGEHGRQVRQVIINKNVRKNLIIWILVQVHGICCPKQSSGIRSTYGSIPSSNPFTRPTNIYSWMQNPYRPTTNGASIDAELTEKQTADCGAGPTKTLSFDEQRIVGGTEAKKNSWPSIVS